MGRGGTPPLLERILEHTIKGLDVEIINRGFSGELAEAAGERLKIEVALNHPDIVLWQVGTNDAFAQVPVETFQLSVSNTVRWLKSHNIDVILVGLHYMKQLAKDEHYQAIRASLRRVASAENVLRIGRYEAMEVLARTAQANGQIDPQDFGLSETSYNCMAQYIARTITVGVFARPPKTNPAAAAVPPPDAPEASAQATCSSALRGLEAGGRCLLLGAEPALAARLLHAHALVVRRPRQDVNARRTGDLTFDGAALRRPALGFVP